MKRGVLIILLSQLLLSCASLGSKEVLVLNNDTHWKTETLSSQESYFFACKSLSLYIDEVVFSKNTHAVGPIVPVVPSNLVHDFEENNLRLIMKIFGMTEDNKFDANSSNISVKLSGEVIEQKNKKISIIHENKKENEKLWVQYSMSFSYKMRLKDIEKLAISFDLPMFSCEIPNLLLHRKKVSDNSFTVAPGI